MYYTARTDVCQQEKDKKSNVFSQQIHRQFIFFSASGLIAVIVCIMLNVFPVSADSTHSQTGSVYYTSIEIQPGDTLWNIAEETMTSEYSSVPEYVKVLKEINSLDSDQLEAGQNLIIAYN